MEDEEDNDRNQRRNLGQNRPEPFRVRHQLSIEHITIMRSQTGSVQRRAHLNPNSRILSLHDFWC